MQYAASFQAQGESAVALRAAALLTAEAYDDADLVEVIVDEAIYTIVAGVPMWVANAAATYDDGA